MSELNREQIIKALEYCKSPKLTKCYGCPREQEDGKCMYRLNEDSLALINELTEENERLKCEGADLKDELKCEKETNAHLGREYMSENHLRHQVEEMLANGMSVVKSDTVREMQKRVYEFADGLDAVSEWEIKNMIDQIAKEMVEDNKNGKS